MFFMDPYDTITSWKPTSGREPINYYGKLNLLQGASELKYIFHLYLNTILNYTTSTNYEYSRTKNVSILNMLYEYKNIKHIK